MISNCFFFFFFNSNVKHNYEPLHPSLANTPKCINNMPSHRKLQIKEEKNKYKKMGVPNQTNTQKQKTTLA